MTLAHAVLMSLESPWRAETEDNACNDAVTALAVAAGAGAITLLSPPTALLILAALAALALWHGAPRLDVRAFAGPVLAAIIVGGLVGLAGAIGVVFAWRIIEDTRWSARLSARLALAADKQMQTGWKARAHVWAAPIYGLTMVAFTAPHMVAGLPLDLPHLPAWVPLCVGLIAAMALFDWALQCAADWRLGELARGRAAHMLGHQMLFLAALGMSFDLSAGIVALAAWRLAHAARLRLPRLALQPSFTAVP